MEELIQAIQREVTLGGFTVDPQTFFRLILGFDKETTQKMLVNESEHDENP